MYPGSAVLATWRATRPPMQEAKHVKASRPAEGGVCWNRAVAGTTATSAKESSRTVMKAHRYGENSLKKLRCKHFG
eukprot:scaffold907_cov398-Prasinococcus_capsulatus_cf.AAC.17